MEKQKSVTLEVADDSSIGTTLRADISIFGMFAFSKSSYYILRHKTMPGLCTMSDKNENIHLFIIKEAYFRIKENKSFSTSARALDAIFGTDYLYKSP